MQINILEARNRLSRLLKAVQTGDEVVIAKRGRPVARLMPVQTEDELTSEPGNPARILDWLDRHPLPDHAQRSADEIEADIRAEREAWD